MVKYLFIISFFFFGGFSCANLFNTLPYESTTNFESMGLIYADIMKEDLLLITLNEGSYSGSYKYGKKKYKISKFNQKLEKKDSVEIATYPYYLMHQVLNDSVLALCYFSDSTSKYINENFRFQYALKYRNDKEKLTFQLVIDLYDDHLKKIKSKKTYLYCTRNEFSKIYQMMSYEHVFQFENYLVDNGRWHKPKLIVPADSISAFKNSFDLILNESHYCIKNTSEITNPFHNISTTEEKSFDTISWYSLILDNKGNSTIGKNTPYREIQSFTDDILVGVKYKYFFNNGLIYESPKYSKNRHYFTYFDTSQLILGIIPNLNTSQFLDNYSKFNIINLNNLRSKPFLQNLDSSVVISLQFNHNVTSIITLNVKEAEPEVRGSISYSSVFTNYGEKYFFWEVRDDVIQRQEYEKTPIGSRSFIEIKDSNCVIIYLNHKSVNVNLNKSSPLSSIQNLIGILPGNSGNNAFLIFIDQSNTGQMHRFKISNYSI